MAEHLDLMAIKQVLAELVVICESVLCKEAVSEVRHYIENNEPEIAFEGLFLELMQINKLPVGLNSKMCLELGLSLKLNEETVLSDSFWSKFVVFIVNA